MYRCKFIIIIIIITPPPSVLIYFYTKPSVALLVVADVASNSIQIYSNFHKKLENLIFTLLLETGRYQLSKQGKDSVSNGPLTLFQWVGIKLIPACRFPFICSMGFALNPSNPTRIELRSKFGCCLLWKYNQNHPSLQSHFFGRYCIFMEVAKWMNYSNDFLSLLTNYCYEWVDGK